MGGKARAQHPTLSSRGPISDLFVFLPTHCLGLWPLSPGSGHLGLRPSTAVSPHTEEQAAPSMAGVGKVSSVHWHQAESGPCWHLDPALASQLSPVVFTHRNGGLTAVRPCALCRPCRGRGSSALSMRQQEPVFTFSHRWQWLGGRQLALVPAPGSWCLGFHSSSRWFCLKTPERGREGCTCLVSSPQQ